MKPGSTMSRSIVFALLLAPMLAVGASKPSRDNASELALYRSHAGEPVQSFRMYGHVTSWMPLGDSAVAVWTRPSEAWLLELDGSCSGLDFTPAIGLTSSAGRVSARFDKVLVRDNVPMHVPCFIQSIRPLDLAALKAAQKAERDQASGT